MKFSVLAVFVFCTTGLVKAQPGNMLLNQQLVDLKGKPGTTVFTNATADTLKMDCLFFNWLPYIEVREKLIIAPGKTDSLVLTYNFPDFVQAGNGLNVYNGPGGRVVCEVKDQKAAAGGVTFSGSFTQENIYYHAYYHYLGSMDQEGRPYYNLGDKLKDWNQFPAGADSITRIRLSFLDSYKNPLPAWFKPHEHRRLLYKQYQMLLNGLMSKEFYGGKAISVGPGYYNFEKLLNRDSDMVLNDTYLYCMNDYFTHLAKLSHRKEADPRAYMIDSLYHTTDIGDVNLMYNLGKLYRFDKQAYDVAINKLQFKDPGRKLWYDSLVQSKLGTPYIGKKAPAMALTDVNGKAVSLDDYKGQMLILNFWATWCGPCKAEFPDENQFYLKYKSKGVTVINICFDSDHEAWLRDSKKFGLQMVNLFTTKADYNKLLKQYNLTAPPRSVLLNREGIVVENYLKRISALSDDEIAKIVNGN